MSPPRALPMLLPLLLIAAVVEPQEPQSTPRPQSTQQPQGVAPQQPSPPAPGGEVAPGATPAGDTDAELGGNPAPIPDTHYALERLLLGTEFWRPVADAGVRVYGWTQGNYTASSASRSNAPTAFNDRADYAAIDQNWLEVVRGIDTSKQEVQFGGRIALIAPGYDYKYTLARGLWNDQSRRYGFDSVYAYGEVFLPGLGANGTTLRVGRWGTSIGWEMIEAIATPFVSRSYNFQYNPFTHTGVQATTALNANVTMYHGLVTGADVFFDAAATASYVGGVKWTADGGATSAAANVFITGKGYDRGEQFQHYNSFNVVLNHELAPGWTYTLDTTLGRTSSSAFSDQSATWYGVANYLSHKLSEEVGLNMRAEWFKDQDGVRTGTRGAYFAFTAGLQIEPNEWLLVRPFARYDHNKNGPFEGDDELWTGGIELIARW